MSGILQSPKLKPVKVNQTSIQIYQTARGEYQFRYYLGGKSQRVTRSSWEKIKEKATEIATSIENGRAQAGAMTAADVQSWTHARRLLTADDPPIHVIVEQWKQFQKKAPGATLEELAALWERSRPRGGGTHDPGASLVETLKEAMIESLEQSAQASGSRPYVVGFRHDLTRFAETFGRRRVGEIGAEEIQAWLRRLGVGARRQDNVRSELVTFFRFARDRGHLIESLRTEPEKVPKLHKPTNEISYYRPAELLKFLEVAQEKGMKEKWVPWLVLQAFAGLRTSEVARIEWEAFDWQARIIYVPASVALKTRRRRRVPIEDNLLAWLTPWHGATGRVYSQADPINNWTQYIQRHLAKKSKLDWRRNDLRHSYGTYQMALSDNFGQVAAWMGNSEAKIKSNYDGVASPVEAKQWFAITRNVSNVIALPGPT